MTETHSAKAIAASGTVPNDPNHHLAMPKAMQVAEINIYAEGDDEYKFLFVAKGGGSANKTFLYQATPSVLTHDRLIAFLKEKILTLGSRAFVNKGLVATGRMSASLRDKFGETFGSGSAIAVDPNM